MPNRKPVWVFGYADRVGAKKVIFVAPDEVKEGMVRVKDLRAEKSDKENDKGFNVKLTDLHTLL
jgi:histidyl-tRNA synthetase